MTNCTRTNKKMGQKGPHFFAFIYFRVDFLHPSSFWMGLTNNAQLQLFMYSSGWIFTTEPKNYSSLSRKKNFFTQNYGNLHFFIRWHARSLGSQYCIYPRLWAFHWELLVHAVLYARVIWSMEKVEFSHTVLGVIFLRRVTPDLDHKRGHDFTSNPIKANH